MKTLTIRMFNFLTKEKIGYQKDVPFDFDFEMYAEELRNENPDFTIYLKWDESNCISLVAKNQKTDEEKYVRGELTWNEFSEKWFITLPEIRGLKIEKK